MNIENFEFNRTIIEMELNMNAIKTCIVVHSLLTEWVLKLGLFQTRSGIHDTYCTSIHHKRVETKVFISKTHHK